MSAEEIRQLRDEGKAIASGYCPTCGVSPPEMHWQGCQTAKVTDAADYDEGYRQGRRDTRAELVPVIDRQRAEIEQLREHADKLRDVLGLS